MAVVSAVDSDILTGFILHCLVLMNTVVDKGKWKLELINTECLKLEEKCKAIGKLLAR